MSISPGESPEETDRQRVRDQIDALLQGLGGTAIVDTDDSADFGYICSNEHVLVADAEGVGELDAYFNERFREQDEDGSTVDASLRLVNEPGTWGGQFVGREGLRDWSPSPSRRDSPRVRRARASTEPRSAARAAGRTAAPC